MNSFFLDWLVQIFHLTALKSSFLKIVFWMEEGAVYRWLNHLSAGTVTMILPPLAPGTPCKKLHRRRVRGCLKSMLTLIFYAEYVKFFQFNLYFYGSYLKAAIY